MIKKSLPLVALALLAAGSVHLAGQQKTAKSAARQKPPAALGQCPDIAVSQLRATLVSTLLGDLQVEVPMDTVKLEATLENIGSEAVPSGAYLYIIVKKNGKVIQSANATDTLGAPGSRWAYSVNDSFPHGQKTTYAIQAASALKECRVSNNQATLLIDEKKLHPEGNPDMTIRIISIEKNWRHEGERIQASYELAVDVTNQGSGYSNSPSRLLFIQNDDQVLATLDIPQHELPGPGQKRRFTTQLTAAQVPFGDVQVSAHIEPARNEFVCNNNWSLSSGQISNSADPPARVQAVLDFEPWSMTGKTVSATIQVTNLQKGYLRSTRLLLLKNNVPVKEWKPLKISPQEPFIVRYLEERQSLSVRFGIDRFRAILTSDPDHMPPPRESILDARSRNLCWVEMSAGWLQNNLQEKNNGLAALVARQNQNFRIKETLAQISPPGILVSVKGRKTVDLGPAVEFHAEIHLRPRVVFGQVQVEVTKTVVHLGTGLSEFFGSLLEPILCQSISAYIERSAAKELDRNLSAMPPGLRSQYGAPLGVILASGAMDVYF